VGTRNARLLYKKVRENLDESTNDTYFEIRNNFAHSLGNSKRRNDVVVDTTTTTPVLAGWTIDSLLGRSGGTIVIKPSKLSIVDDLGRRCKGALEIYI
jgi:hypothetical protein